MLRNHLSKSSIIASRVLGYGLVSSRVTLSTDIAPQKFDSSSERTFKSLASIAFIGAALGSAAVCEEKVELKDHTLGNLKDFPNGKSTPVKITEEFTVLVTNINGKIHVTGNSCPHYSAPLSNGVTTATHVTCPWHDAEFSLTTGECTNGPSLDPIPVYPFTVAKDGTLIAHLPSHDGVFNRRLAARDPNNHTTYVICGGGPAALTAAETLRYEGFTGRIVMLSAELHAPYDRPVLSKNSNPDLQEMTLRPLDRMENEFAIDFMGGKTVVDVNTQTKEVCFKATAFSKKKSSSEATEEKESNNTNQVVDGSLQTMKYDKLLIATGTRPRGVFAPGNDAENIVNCRTPEDVTQMKEVLSGRKPEETYVVVIGTSFIGLEMAASFRREGYNVVVVGREKVCFDRVLGRKVGTAIQNFFEDKGVLFVNNASVHQFRKDPQTKMATSVDLDNLLSLPCDLVVCGAGVIPTAQEFLRTDAEMKLAADGSVIVDATMKSRHNDSVFAAGDVCTFPSIYHGGEDVRIEHWAVAMEQARVAARNMCGKVSVYNKVPFFWTSWFGRMLRYAGNNRGFTDVIIEGDLKKMRWIAYYVKDGKIVSVATIGRDPVAVAFAELLAHGIVISEKDVREGIVDGNKMVDMVSEMAKGNLKTGKHL